MQLNENDDVFTKIMKAMNNVKSEYDSVCNPSSPKSIDIIEHLPTLYKYATECETIIECGVRGCVSSWAFVNGLLNNNKKTKKILLNDVSSCDISELLKQTQYLPIDVSYQWVNNLNLNVESNYDMVFIDTWHVYGHLKRELNKFHSTTNKYIVMHDTTVDEIKGETLRLYLNSHQQSLETGYSIDEIECGLKKAITEFLKEHPEWEIHEKFANNNGLTILKKVM